MSSFDIITDHSNKNLKEFPEEILGMTNLRMLYFERNFIRFLPEDFFKSLPHLTWIDLRNNCLEDIPSNVGDHKKLETMLLQNNSLEFLPNELGLIPTLKMLQVAGNPLLYPPKDVLEGGTNTICSYLKDQHSKIVNMDSDIIKEKEDPEPEREHKVANRSSTSTSKASEKISVYDALRRSIKSGNLSISTLPVISVKSLSKNENAVQPSTTTGGGGGGEEVVEKKHKIFRHCPKFTVRSQFVNGNRTIKTTMKIKAKHSEIDEQILKDMWLSKLKELLSEQEKLIQQEKNLKSLNNWRIEKKIEPARLPSEEEIIIPPYATESEHDRILSREDLRKQFDKVVKQRKLITKKTQPNIEKLMDDVISQLKSIEQQIIPDASPRSKITNSEKEIKAILDLHKRIASLQVINHNY